jgi:hypothetical protein
LQKLLPILFFTSFVNDHAFMSMRGFLRQVSFGSSGIRFYFSTSFIHYQAFNARSGFLKQVSFAGATIDIVYLKSFVNFMH